jgi:succinoglycan biosynthesis transport protein ExoP
VIVDCDLRQRAVNRALDTDPSIGLLEVLNGVSSLDQAMVKDELSGAMILPLARSAHTPKDVFGAPAMARLITELRGRFDVVLLDTAPILPVADTRVLAPLADVVVVLARWRKTQRKAVEATLRLLGTTDSYVAGVALTQVNLREQSRYGYGDPGYYYQSYRKYYGG